MRIVVLGGSGVLGGAVADRALAADHTVVTVSRGALERKGATHVRADVKTGAGLAEAFEGADAIIDATNAMKDAREVLVEGTRRVLEAARDAKVKHYVGISIVGIDDAPLEYYGVKRDQEKVIEEGPVPYSLLRATQFHDLVPRFVEGTLGVVFAPSGWSLQPIDAGEVASELVSAAAAGPRKRLPDVGGPEIIAVAELARMWKDAMNKTRLVLSVPVPGKLGAFLRSGKMCAPDRKIGKKTFREWLAERAPR